MKDFAKSIRTENAKSCNEDWSDIIEAAKRTLAEKKRLGWASDDEIKDLEQRIKALEERQKRENKTENAKACNEATVLKDGDVWVVLYANETKSKEFDTEAEARAFAKQVGNKKVGNREISLSASNSGELNLHDNGTGFMYDPIELGRYDINGKSDAMATVRELEKLKREAEAKIRDCQKFIDTLKQWANELK